MGAVLVSHPGNKKNDKDGNVKFPPKPCRLTALFAVPVGLGAGAVGKGHNFVGN